MLKGKFKSKKEAEVNFNFDSLTTHKKITGLNSFSNKTLKQLSVELDLKSTLEELKNIINDCIYANFEPTLLEIKAIDLYRTNERFILETIVNKIEIATRNPHIKKALSIYNDISFKNEDEKTLLSFFYNTSKILKEQNLETLSFGNEKKNVFKCKGPFNGTMRNLFVEISHHSSFNDEVSSVENAVYKSSGTGFEPVAIVENNVDSETTYETISEIGDALGVSTFLHNSYGQDVSKKYNINEISVLGVSPHNATNILESSNGDRILIIQAATNKITKCVDFTKLSLAGAFHHFKIQPLTCESGLFYALTKLELGCDIFVDRIPTFFESYEDFLLKPLYSCIVVSIKTDNKKAFTEFCEQRKFNVSEIGKITKSSSIRLVKGPVSIFSLSKKLLIGDKYKSTKYKVKENNSFNLSTPYIKPKPEERLEASVFDIFMGGKTMSPLYVGFNQNTKSQATILTMEPYGFDSLKLLFSSQIALERQEVFNDVIESMVSAILKLVCLGVPTHQIATTLSLYYPYENDYESYGLLLEAILGVLYFQMIPSIPNITTEINKVKSEKMLFIAHAIGYTNNIIIKNQFSIGEKIFMFPLKRDSYNMPEIKYFLKLTSSINMQILAGNITAATYIEDSLLETIASSIIGNNLGFSFAISDESRIQASKGCLLLAIKDIKELSNLESIYLGVIDSSGIVKGNKELAKIKAIIKAKETPQIKNNVAQIAITPKPIKPAIFNKHLKSPNVLILTYDRVAGEMYRDICHKAGFRVNTRNLNKEMLITDLFLRGLRADISKSNIIILCGQNIEPEKLDGDALYSILRRPEILDAINEVIFRNLGLLFGSGEGTRTLFRLGFLPYGTAENPPVNFESNKVDNIKAFVQKIRISTKKSIWFESVEVGQVFEVPFPEEKMRLKLDNSLKEIVIKNAQITSQYVDCNGFVTIDSTANSLNSSFSMGSITSPGGRVVGFFSPVEKTYYVENGTGVLLDTMFNDAKKYFAGAFN